MSASPRRSRASASRWRSSAVRPTYSDAPPGRRTPKRASAFAKIGISVPSGIRAELVSVERKPRLEAQGVARAEAGRHRARRDEPAPEAPDRLRLGEELEADPLARVAGARDEELPAFEAGLGVEVASLLGEGAGRRHRFEHPLGVRALQGDHGERLALVVKADVAFQTRLDPLEVASTVRGVDDEEEVVLAKPVEVGVVLGRLVRWR